MVGRFLVPPLVSCGQDLEAKSSNGEMNQTSLDFALGLEGPPNAALHSIVAMTGWTKYTSGSETGEGKGELEQIELL